MALRNKIITRGNAVITKGNKVVTGCGEGPPATPACCTNGVCCFDTANMRFRGHASFIMREYSGLGCTGTVLHTWTLDFDFDLPHDTFGCGTSYEITSNPDGSINGDEHLSNIHATYDGVLFTIGGEAGDKFRIFRFYQRFDGTNWTVDLDTLNGGTGEIGGVGLQTAGGGNCLGFASQTLGPVCANPDGETYSKKAWLTCNLAIADNFCCMSGETCGPSTTPLTKGDGTC